MNNARSLQQMTDHILDKFDAYMSGINQVRERDENYEKRVAELLLRMEQENKDLSVLIRELGNRIQSLQSGPVQVTADLKSDDALKEISETLSLMKENVINISTTLSVLTEEA